MIIGSVRSNAAFSSGRLDAKYHCSPGVLAKERMLTLAAAGVKMRLLAGDGGLGRVGATSRTRRVYAAEGEESMPYLRPYDVFDYLPQSVDQLSKRGGVALKDLIPEVGTILQTCSGRNLGPLVCVDEYISQFVVSDDMLRLHISDETDRLYALTFLSTSTGQALLTRNKTGNVIDHLSADDLAATQVPFFEPNLVKNIADEMGKAIKIRERARLRLQQLIREFTESLPPLPSSRPRREGWTLQASSIGTRFDAAFHDPLVDQIRSNLIALGGKRVRDVASTSMLNRYKRYYVDEGHGRPIMSGRHLLQMKPVNLRYISARSLDFKEYELGVGTLVFGARGRAEGRISLPAIITEDRSNWLASHNVMRICPNTNVSSGWLYLCFSTMHVQLQVKSSAFGSVVDVVDPVSLNEVVLPPENKEKGSEAYECWTNFAKANRLEKEVIDRLDKLLLGYL